MARKKRGKQQRQHPYFWRLQLLVSVLFCGMTIFLGIFPWKILIPLLLLPLLLLLFTRHRKGSLFVLLCTLCFAVLTIFFFQAEWALHEVTGDGETVDLAVTEEPFHLYISGIDAYGEVTGTHRSDVNMLASIDPLGQRLLLTTTPRDYYVQIPGVSGEAYDKLTHAGLYGVEASVATLEQLYEIEIPFYVRVSFTSLEELVDQLGGVDVESSVSFTTGKEAGEIVTISEGTNHLNGKQALAFARERKAFTDGDNQRGKNQEALLSAMIEKIKSPRILWQVSGMLRCVAGNMRTNLSEAQVKALIRQQLTELTAWDVASQAATGEDTGKALCYSYAGGPLYVTRPDDTSVAHIKEQLRMYVPEQD